jgi:hypothetical protein
MGFAALYPSYKTAMTDRYFAAFRFRA